MILLNIISIHFKNHFLLVKICPLSYNSTSIRTQWFLLSLCSAINIIQYLSKLITCKIILKYHDDQSSSMYKY